MTSCCDKRLRIIDPRSDADRAAQVRLVVFTVERYQSLLSKYRFFFQFRKRKCLQMQKTLEQSICPTQTTFLFLVSLRLVSLVNFQLIVQCKLNAFPVFRFSLVLDLSAFVTFETSYRWLPPRRSTCLPSKYSH